MYKIELVNLYKAAGVPMSASILRNLLNKRFYNQLSAVGYNRSDKILSPVVLDKFYELYGRP